MFSSRTSGEVGRGEKRRPAWETEPGWARRGVERNLAGRVGPPAGAGVCSEGRRGPEASGTRSPRLAAPLAPDFGSAGAGMQGCSTHLVHLGYHLIPAPHPEAQQVVKLLRVPQALHELHVDGRMPGLVITWLIPRIAPDTRIRLGRSGGRGRSGGGPSAAPPRPLPAHLNGPRALELLPAGL